MSEQVSLEQILHTVGGSVALFQDKFIWTAGAANYDDAWDQRCEAEKFFEKVGVRIQEPYTDHDTIQIVFELGGDAALVNELDWHELFMYAWLEMGTSGIKEFLSGGWTNLTEHEVAIIENEFRDWMWEKHGRLISHGY
jgi:hypothetical protein